MHDGWEIVEDEFIFLDTITELKLESNLDIHLKRLFNLYGVVE